MSQRLSTVLLAAGLFLGATPVAASAAFDLEHSGGHGRYCWHYDDDWGWYRARCGGHHHGHHGHGHHGHGHHGHGHGHGHAHDGSYDRDRDSAHGSGGYDHHREHDR